MIDEIEQSGGHEKVLVGFYFSGQAVVTKEGKQELVLANNEYLDTCSLIRESIHRGFVRTISIYDACRTPKPDVELGDTTKKHQSVDFRVYHYKENNLD